MGMALEITRLQQTRWKLIRHIESDVVLLKVTEVNKLI
jgi:hypothetical protein